MQITLISNSKVGRSRLIKNQPHTMSDYSTERVNGGCTQIKKYPHTYLQITSLVCFPHPFLTLIQSTSISSLHLSSRFQVALPQLTELHHGKFSVDAKLMDEKEKKNLPKQPAGSESSHCWLAGKPRAKTHLWALPLHMFSSCRDSTGSAEMNGTGL